MTGATIASYAVIYMLVIGAGLSAGIVVNLLADRVATEAPTPPSPTREDHAARGAAFKEDNGAATSAATSADPHIPRQAASPSAWDRLRIRRRVTPLALGLLFPLLLAHTLATAAQAPGRLPVWAIFITQAICVAILAGVFVVDLEHRLIFDVAIFPLAVGLLALALLADRRALPTLALAAALAGLLFLLFYGLGFLLYRQEAMGFGDVKLAALVGLIVGWPAITTTLLATAIVGAIASMLLLAFSDLSRRAFIPFGVFLAVGAVVALLAAPPVW